MASTGPVIFCGIAALIFWAVIGLPIARRVAPPNLALPMAPALGWAVHSALALPLYRFIGFTGGTVASCSLAVFIVALPFAVRAATDALRARNVSLWAYGLAALLAILPASAILPKIAGDAVTLSPAIFDHSKIAIIDAMIRFGLPPINPFFSEAGQQAPFVYYYLWHFGAAELALGFGVSGWEADAALTGVTAFSSLSLMIGIASWIGGRSAGLWIAPLAFAGSLRPTLELLLGAQTLGEILLQQTGLAGWLFQSAWAPQHIASAASILIAVLLIVRLARDDSIATALALGITSAAAFESSIWVGGVLLAAAGPVIGVALLLRDKIDRRSFVVTAAIAAGVMMLLIFPLLRDQIASAAARDAGYPIALSPYEVFNIWVPDELQRPLDLPGYWLVFLVVEFPAIYVPGFISLVTTIRKRVVDDATIDVATAFLIVAVTGFTIAGYFTITIADNNDLGWRAILPGVFALIIFAAIGLARWITAPRPIAAALTLALLLLSLPNSLKLAKEYWRGSPTDSDAAFKTTSALWEAVRRHSVPDDRVAINPLFMDEMTPWPINISWALLSDRSSCFAGSDYMRPFTTLSGLDIERVADTFGRVFDGKPQPADVVALHSRYQCRLIVLTPEDEAWQNDPFRQGGTYSLVDETPRWRLYRAKD